MAAAFAAGSAFVVAQETTLSNALKANAAQGLMKFTVTIATSDNPGYLRAQNGNLYAATYLAGIMDALAQQNIYSYEVSLDINATDISVTSIDFNFDFHSEHTHVKTIQASCHKKYIPGQPQHNG